MFAKYYSGGKLYVTCGHVAEIGRQLVSAAGYPARVVQVITRDEFDYSNDGHLMLEVYADGRWQLYDLDSNVKAVDDQGRPQSLVEQVDAVRENRAHWQIIADDPLWNENEPNQASLAVAIDVFSNPARFYRRVMGTPLLPKDPYGRINYGTWFWDAGQMIRLQAYSGGSSRTLASDAQWQQLNGPPVSVLVEHATVTPTPSIAVAPVATATPTRKVGKRKRARTNRSASRRRVRGSRRAWLECCRASPGASGSYGRNGFR
jgi:hypothetical protein